jgi:hypothetical protein
MEPVPLLLAVAGAPAAERDERREHGGELIDRFRPELRFEPVGIDGAEVVVERLEYRGEGDVALELRRPAAQHEPAATVCPQGELRQQARLADSWLPGDLEPAGLAGLDPIERRLEQP